MKFKYVISETNDPFKNLALEHVLFGAVGSGRVILYLWQNDNTIVIGKNQNINSECRVEEFEKAGGIIARRLSGGGAVYHDLGNLNFSFICREKDIVNYQEIIKEALGHFGIQSAFNGRNDLVVSGRKFSGNAVYNDGTVICQHGTILIDSDIGKMSYYLTPDRSKLERHHVNSVESRVINLSAVSGKVTIKSMIESMIRTTQAEKLDWQYKENDFIKEYKRFSNREWIFGGNI